MFRRSIVTVLAALMSLMAMAGIASAHATVAPKEVNAASYEKFVLRVPNEKTSATVKVKVEVPEGFAVSRVKPVPGWKYEFTKSADGKSVTAITWSGSKILDGEFQEFEFQGKTHSTPGKYAWRAYQTYEDGETVAWTGASDAPKPASFMDVKAAATKTDAHGQEQKAPEAAKPATPAAPAAAPAPTAAASSPLTTAAAYGGLALGVIALILALRRK